MCPRSTFGEDLSAVPRQSADAIKLQRETHTSLGGVDSGCAAGGRLHTYIHTYTLTSFKLLPPAN